MHRVGTSPSKRLLALAAGVTALATAGCGGGLAPLPGEPVAPPPASPAWRPGEAMAMLLRPPADGANPIDDPYLYRTRFFRERIAEADSMADGLRRIERIDRGGRRTWYLDGPDPILLRIDANDDGTLDQSQYFGPEGLYAVVHRFAGGRRMQRIYWPPGEPRIVEVRDAVPPYPGVWWRTEESPFPRSGPGGESDESTPFGIAPAEPQSGGGPADAIIPDDAALPETSATTGMAAP